MTFINIAKDDIRPLFIDPSDITALAITESGTKLSIYNGQGEVLYVNLHDWNLDATDVVQKLENSGISLFPITMGHEDTEFQHYIVPSAVTFATVSLPVKNGRVGAIIGVRGVGRVETWEGGTTQDAIDNLMDAVRQMKTIFAYKPEEACAGWMQPAVLYIDPASVTQMYGAPSNERIDILFSDTVRLNVHVVPEGQFEQQAVDIANAAAGSRQHRAGATAKELFEDFQKEAVRTRVSLNEIVNQLKDAATRARVDFVNIIAVANGHLLNVSNQTLIVLLREEDIARVSFSTARDSGEPGLVIGLKERSGSGGGGKSFNLAFNTAAERATVLASLLQRNEPQVKSPPGLKP
jgi:hypothetical protein